MSDTFFDDVEVTPEPQPTGESVYRGIGKGILSENLFAVGLANVFGQDELRRSEQEFSDIFNPTQADPDYSPLTDSNLQGRPDRLVDMLDSKSAGETAKRLAHLDRIEAEMGRDSPGYAVGALVGALVDPSSFLIPGLMGAKLGRAALSFGGVSLAEEALKPERTPADLAIAGSAGLLAGSIGSLLGVSARNAARVEKDLSEGISKFERGSDIDLRGLGPLRADTDRPTGLVQDPQALYESVQLGNAARRRGLNPAYAKELEDEGTVRASFGRTVSFGGRMVDLDLAKLGDNPVKRVLNSMSIEARKLAPAILEVPFKLEKNLKGVTQGFSVERKVARHRLSVVQIMRETDAAYRDYVIRATGAPPTFADRFGRGGETLSFSQFKREISRSRLQGFQHDIPEVARAAQKSEDLLYGPLGRRAGQLGLFGAELQRRGAALEKELSVLKQLDAGENADEIARLTKEIDQIKASQARVAAAGGLRKNFLNIMWKPSVIQSRKAEFKALLMAEGKIAKAEGGLSPITPEDADEIISGMISRPHLIEVETGGVGLSRSLRNRDIEIDHLKVFDFIEQDIFKLSRNYARQTGADVELTEAFGSTDLFDQIKAVSDQYDSLIDSAGALKSGGEDLIKYLKKERDSIISDIEAMRDLVRGTYGLPVNPTRGISKAVRMAKTMNSMVFLTGALAALNDPVRVLMQNGVKRTMGLTVDAFANGMAGFKLARREAQMAGEILDMDLSSRAMALADLGDGFGFADKMEEALTQAASFNFTYINMLNPWTDAMKSWDAMLRGTTFIDVMQKGIDAGKLSKREAGFLSENGIDGAMARRIADQFEKHGTSQGRVKIANTGAWDDVEAAEIYQNALGRMVNIDVVTPGLGDAPLFASTEWGGMLTQFKKFGMAATQRILVSGLQTKDKALMLNFMAMFGAGMMIDYIRSGQNDIDYASKPIGQKITDAIDRSGVMGYFSDINNAIERITAGHFGLAASLGAPPSEKGFTLDSITGLSPTTAYAAKLGDIASGGNGGTPWHIAHNVRRVMPLQNVWWLDPAFDAVEEGMR